MNTIQKNISLKSLNTFGIDASAKLFSTCDSVESIIDTLKANPQENLLILGGGSNLLFTSNEFDGLVIHNQLKGIDRVFENDKFVHVKVGAGEIWHDFVMFTIQNNWGGIENLSLIPGTVGAAPMQNIGAYGVEIKDVFVSLEALEKETYKLKSFSLAECDFGYRNSFFKKEGKNKYIITSVTFKLIKNPTVFNTSYGAIADTLKENGVTIPSVKTISDAVIKIRQSKLPDPKQIGNAGSFFKNPEIPIAHFNTLKETYPAIPSYPINESMIKVPAGWLIEQCGWKGKVVGNTGVHINQALVLVNYGNATGNEIKSLSREIQKSVVEKFNIELETEVNFIV